MAPTETLDIIRLEPRHLHGALALSEEAHWNQVEADWRMMMTAGQAIGIEAPDGRLIASALTLPYGTRFGWVSMVLVTSAWRQKGLATRLLQTCIDTLEGTGLIPVLDATPAGENVYRPMGFDPHFSFQRWQHSGVENIAMEVVNVDEGSTAEPDFVERYDAEVFGGDRPLVLQSLLARSTGFNCRDDGFLLGRSGRVATQIGPIFATDSECGLAMLDRALLRLRGPVFVDACDHQPEFIARLEELGFTPQRPFLRMAKGRAESFGKSVNMFAMAGPELG